nr:helix-hairpin-helix domain-containing protein [Allomuricauda sp.]
MKKSHFRFNKQERSGIFFLLLVIVVLQGVYFLINNYQGAGSTILTIDHGQQAWIDSLRNQQPVQRIHKIFPFNPNYITDYKGYTLGLSPEELDRLYTFRKQGRFVNSADAFQQVTQASDSLMETLSPYFKFPEWTQAVAATSIPIKNEGSTKLEIRDLNKVTAEELQSIRGIGEKLSARIIKFRDRLGGFMVDAQLQDVYGLDQEVVDRTLKRFRVLNPPSVDKININTATAGQLSRLVYINRALAIQIVEYREANGWYKNLDELLLVEGFPKERIDRIKLYLTLKN